MRTVLDLLHSYTSSVPEPGEDTQRVSQYSRYSWLLKTISDEILDEMADRGTDADVIGGWFEQMGKVIQWCGSGDDAVLPPEIRFFLSENHPELLAITVGGDD